MDDKQTTPPQPGQVQIKADEKELQGIYSNLVMIHHHAEEFTLNFVYVFPNGAQGKLLSSVIVSPGTPNAFGGRWERISRGLRRSTGPSRKGRKESCRAATSGLCNSTKQDGEIGCDSAQRVTRRSLFISA